LLLEESLQDDSQNQMTTTAEKGTTSFEENDTQLAYHHLKNWYKTQHTTPSNPTSNDMEAICNKYLKLYSSHQPSIAPIHTYVKYEIQDGVPQEDKVVQVKENAATESVRSLWSFSSADTVMAS
jgi:hypothetical protein